ncbi:acetyl-CoA carboxylase biotin carboxyl carrier protein subunit [Sediminicola sp. 1XM1-17]|uniref:acetyl-CoA carboxylase biotin carboxyl carrier protein subunit n=1 Tax=Sediminicola sp. 1XM1-17 TaxID=3127702 RepID=UPI0030772ADD
MNKKFEVTVDENYSFTIPWSELDQLDTLSMGPGQYHVLQDNRPFKAEVIKSDLNQKEYTVKINNKPYEISITDDLDLLIKEMGFALGSSKQIDSIKAPMPGLILDIHVNPGQSVKEGEPLLILEAMKMENIITSPREGVIKSVPINKGTAIDKGQLLIEFE